MTDMQRTQKPKNWGWENPWDLYCAIKKRTGGAGTLIYCQTDSGHEYQWNVGRWSTRMTFSEEVILYRSVAETADQFVREARARMDQAAARVRQINTHAEVSREYRVGCMVPNTKMRNS